ncbi:Mitochondrial acidic protein MAM33 [Candida viswanathii]|uniref:Mitochondrial acidic protein MAM33 n=1 Tax=Candida viswanathii TaxID=5486 RepID=A0A367YLC7_9ASCO|nr:Mitochondrial acidic protein MAM33 [Candida viswanathii]
MSRLLSTTLRSQLSKRLAASAIRSAPITRVASSGLPKIAITSTLRSFHSTPLVSNKKGDLSQVLEKEVQTFDAIPVELDDAYQTYLQSSGFQLIEKPGTADVELVKRSPDGKHIVHVYFDVEEVAEIPDPEYDPASVEEEADAFDEIFSNIKVLVEDPEKNTGVFFNLLLQPSEDVYTVDFLTPQLDVKGFIEKVSKDGEFVDKFKYQGPKFSELDEAVQVEFENYLNDLGINGDLSDFITGYSDFKEEVEYRKWLKEVNSFFA